MIKGSVLFGLVCWGVGIATKREGVKVPIKQTPFSSFIYLFLKLNFIDKKQGRKSV